MASIKLRAGRTTPLTIAEVDDNFNNLNNDKLETTLFTGTQILNRLKEVDGPGSGLDADILDGLAPSSSNVTNSIVARDESGNFSANTVNANLVGNVTATSLITTTLTASGGITAASFTGTLIGTATNSTQLGGVVAANYALLASPTLTGTPSAPTATAGTNTTQIATTAFVKEALKILYPVGSIYMSVLDTNPATLFGFGTWVSFGAGRTLVGIDGSDALFNTPEKTGGNKDSVVVDHTHSLTDPGHKHVYGKGLAQAIFGGGGGPGVQYLTTNTDTTTSTTGITIANSGVSAVNTNIQPYITVYMWKRTV